MKQIFSLLFSLFIFSKGFAKNLYVYEITIMAAPGGAGPGGDQMISLAKTLEETKNKDTCVEIVSKNGETSGKGNNAVSYETLILTSNALLPESFFSDSLLKSICTNQNNQTVQSCKVGWSYEIVKSEEKSQKDSCFILGSSLGIAKKDQQYEEISNIGTQLEPNKGDLLISDREKSRKTKEQSSLKSQKQL